MKKRVLKWKKEMAAGIILGLTVAASAGLAFADGKELPSSGGPVDEAGAQQIALDDAGIDSADAERLHTKAERDDGQNVFEIEFFADKTEYDYTIREDDGAILEWKLEGTDIGAVAVEKTLEAGMDADSQTDSGSTQTADDGAENAQNPANTYIGIARAKEIALADAQLSQEEVSFTSIGFDTDDGYTDYSVEFRKDRTEYEYTIDAFTGEIVEAEED